MQNEPFSHRLADSIQEAWPFISGVAIIMVATMKMWWSDRRDTKTRVKNLEIIAENSVTHADMHECREEVRKIDDKNLDIVFNELRDIKKDSDKKHSELMEHIIEIHKNKN